MLKTLLHIILFLVSYSLFAQSTITGKVTDNTKQPLSFSNVVLYDNSSNKALKAVIVEENGTYQFNDVKNGTYVVEASLFGYKTERSIVLNIDTAKNVTFDFVMKEDIPENLDEVVVVAKKPVITQNAEKLVVKSQETI